MDAEVFPSVGFLIDSFTCNSVDGSKVLELSLVVSVIRVRFIWLEFVSFRSITFCVSFQRELHFVATNSHWRIETYKTTRTLLQRRLQISSKSTLVSLPSRKFRHCLIVRDEALLEPVHSLHTSLNWTDFGFRITSAVLWWKEAVSMRVANDEQESNRDTASWPGE